MECVQKIIIAPDSFKGSLTAVEAAMACRKAVEAARPDCFPVLIPVADGGEGTVRAVAEATGAALCPAEACDALLRPVVAQYALSPDGLTAVVETAATAGLTLLRHYERNPMLTSSYGLGLNIRHALLSGAKRIYVGLGGSATTDGGMGMLRALGYRFLDEQGYDLQGRGADLARVRTIDISGRLPQLADAVIIGLADVDNPLTGPRGAAPVYGPQKGADPLMVAELDMALAHYADVMTLAGIPSVSDAPGAGAAGGLGYALMAALGAVLRPGIDEILRLSDFDMRAASASLVITGEGHIDSQTLRGKAPYGVMRRARHLGIPCIALAGKVDDRPQLRSAGFADVFCIHRHPLPEAEAMRPCVASAAITSTLYRLLQRN